MMDPKDVSEVQHEEFYRYIAQTHDKPRYTLHYKTDAPLSLRTIFYVPEVVSLAGLGAPHLYHQLSFPTVDQSESKAWMWRGRHRPAPRPPQWALASSASGWEAGVVLRCSAEGDSALFLDSPASLGCSASRPSSL